MDRFCYSRYPNDPINLPYMIVSLASASLTPWWPKLELNILPNLAQSVDSELMDGFWCSRCLNDRIGLPHMIGTLATGATSSLLTKNWTEKSYQPFQDGFWCSRCLNDCSNLPNMIGLLVSGGLIYWVIKNGFFQNFSHIPIPNLGYLIVLPMYSIVHPPVLNATLIKISFLVSLNRKKMLRNFFP